MQSADRDTLLHDSAGDSETQHTVRQQVAKLLFRLAQQQGSHNGHAAEIRLSRQIMADYLGLTLETVCRELMALEREMIVASPDPHAIRIQDLEALQNISRAGN